MGEEVKDGATILGVPRIVHARSVCGRVFWSLVFLLALMVFIMNCYPLIIKYLQYPRKTAVHNDEYQSVPFPHVTICSKNHLDPLVADRIANGTFVDSGDKQDLVRFLSSYSNFTRLAEKFFPPYINIHQEKGKHDMAEVYSRTGLTANLGPDLASVAGVKLDDFVISCRFGNVPCNINAFVKYFDPYYLNCFTFIPDTKTAEVVGNGLSLLLFTGTGKYGHMKTGVDEPDPSLTGGDGVRVIVHAANEKPHPDLLPDGFDAPAGFSISAGLKTSRYQRLAEPYGMCTTDAHGEQSSFDNNKSCKKSCLQKETLLKCGCKDIHNDPNKDVNVPYCLKIPDVPDSCWNTLPNLSDECKSQLDQWKARMDCKRTTRSAKYTSCICRPPCDQIQYDARVDLSNLPERVTNIAFYQLVLNFLQKLKPEKRDILIREMLEGDVNAANVTINGETLNNTDTVARLPLQKHLVRLNIHMSDNNILVMSEHPAYTIAELLSDLGLHLGVFVALAILTLYEFLKLCKDLCCSCCGSKK